jgi:site-specific DNA recombinase
LSVEVINKKRTNYKSRYDEERKSAAGQVIGGKPFSPGALYLALSNRTTARSFTSDNPIRASEHPPIIDQALWDAVQGQLIGNTAERNPGTAPPPARPL